MWWLGGVYVSLFYLYCFRTDMIQKTLKHHSIQYPTISRIAKDYLAIQGSAVASERAFSSGGVTGTVRRSCLKPTTFEALQLLKSAYRQGHISATAQAEFAAPYDNRVDVNEEF
jgi:hAT family C-terminal dimerisation region